MKRNISELLQSADDETISKIVEKHIAADKKTADRIFDKCMGRINDNAEYTEVFTVERAKSHPFIRSFTIAAASLFVVCAAVWGLFRMKSPAPVPTDAPPVVLATVTTVTGTGDAEKTTYTTSAEEESVTSAVRTTTSENKVTNKAAETVSAPKTTSVHSAPIKTDSVKTNAAVTETPPKSTTTTVKHTEKPMTMEEIQEWEKGQWASVLVRARMIADGRLSADSPWITLEQAEEIIAESSDFSEITDKIIAIQPYPDINMGSGVSYNVYRLGGDSSNVIVVDVFGEEIHYHRMANADNVFSDYVSKLLYPKNINRPDIESVRRAITSAHNFSDIQRYAGYSPDIVIENGIFLSDYWLDNSGNDRLIIFQSKTSGSLPDMAVLISGFSTSRPQTEFFPFGGSADGWKPYLESYLSSPPDSLCIDDFR